MMGNFFQPRVFNAPAEGVPFKWGESSLGRDVHGAKRPWGETSSALEALRDALYKYTTTTTTTTMGRNVRGAKSPDTEWGGERERITNNKISD